MTRKATSSSLETSSFQYPSNTSDSKLDQVSFLGQFLGSREDFANATNAALKGDNLAESPSLGNYSTIVERKNEILVSPDISGQFPVYWRQTDKKPRFSTRITSLGDQPSTRYLAAMIGGNIAPLMNGDTVFESVHRVEGGQQALFTKDQPPVITSAEIIPDYELTLNEAAANLREALVEAIEVRLALGKVVTSDCSGGFDSTSISLLAAARTKGPFQAFIQYHPTILSGDMRYAREYIKDTNIHLHELTNENSLPFQKLNRVELHDEPDPATIINARIKSRLLGARACGSELHFTGDGGDAVLDTPPNYLIDLARLGKRLELEQAAYRHARMRHMAPQSLIDYAERNASRTLSDDLKLLSIKIQNPTIPTDKLTWISWPGKSLNLLTPKARRLLSEHAEHQAEALQLPEGLGAADYIARSGLREGGNIHRHLREIAAAMGIETAAPFMDARVVEACLRLPSYMRADARYFKNILREAFEDVLPAALLNRTSKGSYSGEHYKGLRAARLEVEGLLKNSRLADLGVIEPGAVAQEIERVDTGLTAELPALDKIVAAEVWLRKREQVNE